MLLQFLSTASHPAICNPYSHAICTLADPRSEAYSPSSCVCVCGGVCGGGGGGGREGGGRGEGGGREEGEWDKCNSSTADRSYFC